MRRAGLPALALLGLAGLPAACAGGGAPTEPGVVAVRDLRYRPATVTIAAGESVTWRFDDGNIPHDVKGAGFESPALRGREWSHRFPVAGTFEYLCTIHPYMKGEVVVR